MENRFESCGSLYVIYHPLKQTMQFTQSSEVFTRDMIIHLRDALNGESPKISGSLLLRCEHNMLRMDWGSSCIEVFGETVSALRQFLNTLVLSKQEEIYFYEVEVPPYGCFSNCSPHGVELDGQWWRTTEHYFQAQKYTNPYLRDMIHSIPSAKDAAKLGRDQSFSLRPNWDQMKDDVMRCAVLSKFKTHASIRQILLDTGDVPIIENALHDYYWGCGKDGSGKNMLGQILAEVRTILRGK